jgi:tetratricopeptide (TPR) repeat protein
MSENGDSVSDTTEASHLLVLTHSRPAEALARAKALLSRRPPVTPAVASIAHQASGIALRDLGYLEDGLAELRRALRSARAGGEQLREADVLASLGFTTAQAGRTAQGLAYLDRATRLARGVLVGRVLMRRAAILALVGRRAEALSDLNHVVAIMHRHGDFLWEARARSWRGLLLLEMGQTLRADADFIRAEQEYKRDGQEWEYATARHNRGLVAAASGHVPEALAFLSEADQCYERLGTPMLDVAIDRCAILLSAGLATDAWAETDAAVRRVGRDSHGSAKFAELLYSSATAALAADDPLAARNRAEQAAQLFRRQRRDRWSARARLALAQARHARGDTSLSAYRLACSVARQLDAIGADESTQAHLLAGQLALQRGTVASAEDHLAAAARPRRTGPALSRSRALLARALLCQLRGREPEMLSACRRGLAILQEHQQLLGASELRAAVTTHGRELAAIGQRTVLNRADGRQLLVWSERWRATVQAATPARPPRDAELARELSALREVGRRLDRDMVAAQQGPALRRERARLEAAVRARILRTPGSAAAHSHPFTVPALLRALGDAVLVDLIELDGTLHAVTVRGSGIRIYTVGSADDAVREADFARFLLRRLADGRPVPGPSRALAEAGHMLEKAVLGPAVAELEADSVVIVPPGRLNVIPWGLLPVLRGRSVSVSPSATVWMRVRSAPKPPHRAVTLVGGPDLADAKAEVSSLADLYPQATVLTNGMATVGRVLAALDDSWLAHVAAHGTFRADNPLFSSLQLDDGPLTVYDLEGMNRAPHRLVLSACESGRAAPIGSDELLGLASSLIPMGTVGIVAAVVPVSDQVTVSVMRSLHGRLAEGAGFPEALRLARADAAETGDPIVLATACSFVALGV